MNASMSTSPAASAASKASSTSAGVRVYGFSQRTCLPGGERVQRPLVVHAVRERDVDGVELVVGEERLVRAVRLRGSPCSAAYACAFSLVAARDGDDVDGVGLRRARDDRVVDLRGGEKPQPHGATLASRSAG